MKQKLFIALLLSLTWAFHANAQSCKELYRKANDLRTAEKYDEAKRMYQKVKNCGEQSYIKDCDYWIKWIDAVNPPSKPTTVEFGLSDNRVVIPYQGGQWVVNVSGKESWSATVDSEWCSVKKAGTQIIITSKPNEALRNRTATIQVTSGAQYKTITVTNEGVPEMLRSSVTSLTFPSSGDTNVVDIYANTNWRVTDIPSWLTATKENGTIKFIADANNQTTEREANVRVLTPSDSVIVINIYQSAGTEHLAFSKNELNFGPNGGDEYIKVYTDASDWKFGDFPHWCQISRIGADSIKVHCAPNEPINEIREASINVTTGNQTLGVNVRQEAKPIVAMIPVLSIGGKSVSFGVTAGYIYPMISCSSGGNFTGSAVNYALGNNDENASYSTSGGFSVGVHADFRLYKNFYLTAGLNFIHYNYKNEFSADVPRSIAMTKDYYLKGATQNRYAEDYTMNTLEIPILASYRLPITKISHIQFNLGPVISYGLSAKLNLSGNTDSETLSAYWIKNHQFTDEKYDGYRYSMHYMGSGELNMYGKDVSFYQTYTEGNNSDVKKDNLFEASPYKRLNFGVRVGVTYEYAGISFGIEYNMMLTNMANKKYWEGDRWTIFDQVPNVVMSGYKQRNSYLAIKIGYTFRY